MWIYRSIPQPYAVTCPVTRFNVINSNGMMYVKNIGPSAMAGALVNCDSIKYVTLDHKHPLYDGLTTAWINRDDN